MGLFSRGPGPRPARVVAAAMSAAVFIMALLVLSEYLFGWNLGIEEWPVGITGRLGGLHPERVRPATAVSFLLLSIILLACRSIRSRLGLSIAAGLSGAQAIIALVALAGSFLQIFVGYCWGNTGLDVRGIPGALGFFFLAR